MPLSAGDKLGPYDVIAAIGAGGMGEVYKARDTRLDRTVAIKVLPEHIAKREDLRARFEREARSVASLNHPNICSLFDIGDGYMVMELIEGETLAQRIEKGPIPLDQALKLATQIADALERAHRAGVTGYTRICCAASTCDTPYAFRCHANLSPAESGSANGLYPGN